MKRPRLVPVDHTALHRGRSTAGSLVQGFLARRLGEPLVRAGKAARLELLDSLAAPEGAVVLLGDSITDFGEWAELLPERVVANRGVGGETSAELRERVARTIISPSAVSVLIGTNDLTGGTSVAEIVDNIDNILTAINRKAPGVPIILNAVMPRAAKYAREIRALNEWLHSLAQRHGVLFLDMWSELADASGEIQKQYSFDRLHLRADAYALWAERLEQLLSTPLSPAAAPTEEAMPAIGGQDDAQS